MCNAVDANKVYNKSTLKLLEWGFTPPNIGNTTPPFGYCQTNKSVFMESFTYIQVADFGDCNDDSIKLEPGPSSR